MSKEVYIWLHQSVPWLVQKIESAAWLPFSLIKYDKI